jgi:dihydrofolate reductase
MGHCLAMVRKRKIIVYIAASADGFISRSDDSVDWLERPHPKSNYRMGAFYKSIDTILGGGKTYDMALDFQKKGVGSAGGRGVRERINQSIRSPSAGEKRGRTSGRWVALASLRRFSTKD